MYKNPVHHANVFLYGRRTSFLHMQMVMRVAEQLKTLRESIPGSPGVRQIARELGYEKHNGYGYYEGTSFNKPTLPLDKAREFAVVFDRLGGDGAAVLRLAGLADDEVSREANPPIEPRPLLIPMSVAFPSEDAIVAMMRGLLRGVGLDSEADKFAETLAQRLPKALAQASGQLAVQASSKATSRGEPARLGAMRDPDHLQ